MPQLEAQVAQALRDNSSHFWLVPLQSPTKYSKHKNVVAAPAALGEVRALVLGRC